MDYPPGYTVMEQEHLNPKTGTAWVEPLFVKRVPSMSGDSVSQAFASMTDFGGFQINLNFTKKGTEQFRKLTARIADENNAPPYNSYPENTPGKYGRLAIVLDGELYSAPRVTEAIPGGSARIYETSTEHAGGRTDRGT